MQDSQSEATPKASSMDDASIKLHGVPLAAGIFVLAIANFMAILDLTIVNVAVPHIAGALAVSPNEGTWVITSYAVAEAVTVPLSGWLAARFGTVRVFMWATSSFSLFSALCGFAPSLSTLVFFRILQGLAGGPLIPISQTLLLRITPPDKTNLAMGLWLMTTILAPIAGPLLGGAITDTIGYSWAFYINIPVAIFCTAAAWQMMKRRETEIIKNPIDFVGMALLIVFVAAAQIMLDNGLNKDWFGSPFIVTLFIISALAFVMFLIWELTDEHPIVNLRVFRHRGFTVSAAAMGLTYGSFLASIVLIPLWLQINMGYTASWAGHVLAVQGLTGMIMAPIAAVLLSRLDPRLMMSTGLAILSCAILFRTSFTHDMTFWQLLPPQLAMGFGMPLFFVPLMTLALSSVNPEETAYAAGLLNFIRTAAGALATASVTAAWSAQSTVTRDGLASTLNHPDELLRQMQLAGIPPNQSLFLMDQMVQSQAVMLATNHIFFIIGLIVAITAVGIWAMPKASRPAEMPMSH